MLPRKAALLFCLFFSLSFAFSEKAFVKRVVDGDTLALEDGRKVRLIGVDTPELHESEKMLRDSKRTGMEISAIQELGLRAKAFVKSLVDQKEIELEYDPVNEHGGNRDKYGRTLAYVLVICDKPRPEYLQYLEKKGESFKPGALMLNRLLLQCGYANVYTKFSFQYKEEFRQYEKEAREFGLGLWHTGGLDKLESDLKQINSQEAEEIVARFPVRDYSYVSSIKSQIFHFKDCSSAKAIKPADLQFFKTEEEAMRAGKVLCKQCQRKHS